MQWDHSIVTFVDLIGVKKRSQGGEGSKLMRQLHHTATNHLRGRLPSIHRIYAWNDSLLLLSRVPNNDAKTYEAALRDASELKRAIDKICRSYAIAVKGQTFPRTRTSRKDEPRISVLETSSWAMANCFLIEESLRDLHASWYVDGRIARVVSADGVSTKHKVTLLPNNQQRTVHAFKGPLWLTGAA